MAHIRTMMLATRRGSMPPLLLVRDAIAPLGVPRWGATPGSLKHGSLTNMRDWMETSTCTTHRTKVSVHRDRAARSTLFVTHDLDCTCASPMTTQ
jgi:hypothetical protein